MAVDSGTLNLDFRILRLGAPTILASPSPFPRDASEACGFSPMLQLPGVGDVLLGETFSCYVRLINLADAALSSVSVKCDLQTERQRLTLHDNSDKPLPQLAPGASYDFLLSHDVKEPNEHVLTCSASYAAADGSPHAEQQSMAFSASNPLSVRTKTRLVAGSALLEVCVENANEATPIFLDYVRLEPAAGASPAEPLTMPQPATAPADAAVLLQRHMDSMKIIGPGAARNLLFRLQMPARPSGSGPADRKTDLGKLEMKWRRSMGEAGRLQTQHILLGGTAAGHPAVELQLTRLPPAVQLEVPFAATLTLRNNLDRRLGPLQLAFQEQLTGAATQPPFLILGSEQVSVPEQPPHSSSSIEINLLPTAPGVHSFSGVNLVEQGSGKPVASLDAVDILVQMGPQL